MKVCKDTPDFLPLGDRQIAELLRRGKDAERDINVVSDEEAERRLSKWLVDPEGESSDD